MDMGNRIKELRLQANLTQTELGAKLGVGASAIAKYEKGRVQNLKQSTIAKMAEIFHCAPSHLREYLHLTRCGPGNSIETDGPLERIHDVVHLHAHV